MAARWKSQRCRLPEDATGGLSKSQVRSQKRRHTLRCLKAALAFQLQHGKVMPAAIGSKDLELFRNKLYGPKDVGELFSEEVVANGSPGYGGERWPTWPLVWWPSHPQADGWQDHHAWPMYLPGAPAAVATPPVAVPLAEKRAGPPDGAFSWSSNYKEDRGKLFQRPPRPLQLSVVAGSECQELSERLGPVPHGQPTGFSSKDPKPLQPVRSCLKGKAKETETTAVSLPPSPPKQQPPLQASAEGEESEDDGSSAGSEELPTYDDFEETDEPHPRFSWLRTADVHAGAASCKATLCNLRPTCYNYLYSVSAEARPPNGSSAKLSLPPSLRKLEEERLADMYSGASTFKKLFACA